MNDKYQFATGGFQSVSIAPMVDGVKGETNPFVPGKHVYMFNKVDSPEFSFDVDMINLSFEATFTSTTTAFRRFLPNPLSRKALHNKRRRLLRLVRRAVRLRRSVWSKEWLVQVQVKPVEDK